MGLRPHLSRMGKQTSGANFLQGMLSDMEVGRRLAEEGDRKARFFRRVIWAGIWLILIGFLVMIW